MRFDIKVCIKDRGAYLFGSNQLCENESQDKQFLCDFNFAELSLTNVSRMDSSCQWSNIMIFYQIRDLKFTNLKFIKVKIHK